MDASLSYSTPTSTTLCQTALHLDQIHSVTFDQISWYLFSLKVSFFLFWSKPNVGLFDQIRGDGLFGQIIT